MRVAAYLRDLNAAAVAAGVAAFALYVFMGLPVQLAVFQQLGLTDAQASSWLFITWFTTAIASIAVAVRLRQPVSITMSLPGLIYLGTLTQQFTFDQLAGANLAAGVIIIALGAFGIGERILRWLPAPIILGMFAGSILGMVTRVVSATVSDVWLAGPAVVAYLAGRAMGNPRIPPMGLAVVVAAATVLVAGQVAGPVAPLGIPTLVIPSFHFTWAAFLAVTLPMVLLTVAVGNVQGLGFLQAQGYVVRANMLTLVGGVTSVVNSLFGGHAAGVGRAAIAVMASSEAGPAGGRYWAAVLVSLLTLGLALAAGPVTSLITVVPTAIIATLAGLAVLSPLEGALSQAFGHRLRFGGLVAFVVAATPFTVAGVASPFWAVVAGMAASALGERRELLAHWRPATTREEG